MIRGHLVDTLVCSSCQSQLPSILSGLEDTMRGEGKGPALFSVGKMLLTATSQCFSSRCTVEPQSLVGAGARRERRHLGKGSAQER